MDDLFINVNNVQQRPKWKKYKKIYHNLDLLPNKVYKDDLIRMKIQFLTIKYQLDNLNPQKFKEEFLTFLQEFSWIVRNNILKQIEAAALLQENLVEYN